VELALSEMSRTDMIFVASHNQDTVNLVKGILEDEGPEMKSRVKFGQLLGFSD